MLHRQDPFADLFRLHDQLWGRAFTRAAERNGHDEHVHRPPVDVYEDEDGLVLQAELPGLAASDVEIELEKDTLTLRGERKLEKTAGEGARYVERRWTRFERSFRLPEGVNPESAAAEMANGVLTLRFEKKAEVKPRKIEVRTSEKKPLDVA